jgi:peroxiredoxin
VEVHGRLAKALGLSFPLLSDADLAVTDAWGLRHREPLGPAGGDIPRPAVFVVDGTGAIRKRWLTDNWRVRVRPEQVLEELGKTGPGA